MRFWKRAESDLEREIAHHLYELTAEYERRGHSRAEAQRMARREFGGVEQVKEGCRDERRFAWFTGFGQDVVFGLRMMRRTPAITVAAVLSLALGIGANAAIASLMDLILWRTLPVPQARQLRMVNWQGHGFPRELADGASGSMYRGDGGGEVADFFSYPAYEAMRQQLEGQAALAAHQSPQAVSVTFGSLPVVARAQPVSGEFHRTLGVQAQLGRVLLPEDDRTSTPPVAVVTHRFWQQSLRGDTGVVGKALGINQVPHVVVGVLAPDFWGLYPGDDTAIYVPLRQAARRASKDSAGWMTDARQWGTHVIARLAPEANETGVRAAMDTVFQSTWAGKPKSETAAPRIRLDDGARGLGVIRRTFRNPLLVLGGLVSLLLVIACLNIANLLLARAVARRKEIAMRVSLGCSQTRLMRQFLTESALLALLGGAASLGVAYGTGNLLAQFVGHRESLPLEVHLDLRVLSLVALITMAALAIFALLPAWQGSRRLELSWLKRGGGSMGGGQQRKWSTGPALVVAQMAMAVVLVMAAVIFTRNLRAIDTADPGFDRRNLVLFEIRPGTSGYDKARLAQFYFDVEQRLAATPGVARAGIASMRPMNIGGWWEQLRLEGQSEGHQASINGITPSYLPVFKAGLAAGRTLTWADIHSGAKVAVISEDLARKLGGVAILGKTLSMASGPKGQREAYEIVGIAPAMAVTSMKERPFAMWLPLPRDAESAVVVVRTSQPPAAVVPAIRRTMAEVDDKLPLVGVVSMEEQIAKGLQRERMFATLCGGFGILAIVLSIVGLYGVMAYSTSQRRSEIGLRLALGAVPRDVVRMLLREGLAMAVAGIAFGLPVVWLCAKYAEKELFQMKVLEPVPVAWVIGIVLAAALLAIGVPAARASALQPSETLREQ